MRHINSYNKLLESIDTIANALEDISLELKDEGYIARINQTYPTDDPNIVPVLILKPLDGKWASHTPSKNWIEFELRNVISHMERMITYMESEGYDFDIFVGFSIGSDTSMSREFMDWDKKSKVDAPLKYVDIKFRKRD